MTATTGTKRALHVPVVPGEGIGPGLWKAVRPVLEAAARAGGRTVTWNEVSEADAAASFRETGFGLRGPLASAGRGLRATLGLSLRALRVGTGLVVHPLDGPFAPAELMAAGVESNTLLDELQRRDPGAFARIRFGSRERTDAFQRSLGRREPAAVEVGVAVLPFARGAFITALTTAIDEALARKQRRAVLTWDAEDWTGSDLQAPFTAFGVVPMLYQDRVFTRWHLDRVRELEGDAAADEVLAEVEKTGALFLDFAPVDDLLGAETTESFVVATSSAVQLLAPVAAARAGGVGSVAAASFDETRSIAVFETLHGTASALAGGDAADASALLVAGGELFTHAGWDDVGGRLQRAVQQVRTSEARGTTAFVRGVLEALPKA